MIKMKTFSSKSKEEHNDIWQIYTKYLDFCKYYKIFIVFMPENYTVENEVMPQYLVYIIWAVT